MIRFALRFFQTPGESRTTQPPSYPPSSRQKVLNLLASLPTCPGLCFLPWTCSVFLAGRPYIKMTVVCVGTTRSRGARRRTIQCFYQFFRRPFHLCVFCRSTRSRIRRTGTRRPIAYLSLLATPRPNSGTRLRAACSWTATRIRELRLPHVCSSRSCCGVLPLSNDRRGSHFFFSRLRSRPCLSQGMKIANPEGKKPTSTH